MGGIMARVRNQGVLHQVDQWIAISAAQKQEHIAMGIPDERITVIHHFFEPKGEVPPYSEDGDVLFVGRLSQEKGVDRLLRAWRGVQYLGRSLWIVGDGPEKETLEKLAHSLNLKNVFFTGFLKHEEILKIWEKSACSVVPSIWKEPFGMVVLEAWAKGRPVVAHNIGALSEIIRQGRDGYLVAPDNPFEMTNAILRILNDPLRGASMGLEGARRLKDDFAKEAWFGKIHSVFKKIVMQEKL
jgi:glycosyltransferase involved in cell wall biosynthesis